MDENDQEKAMEVAVHRQALFTVHHLRHLVGDLKQPLSRKYRTAWGEGRLPTLVSATEALGRLVEIDHVEEKPDTRAPRAWLDEWQRGFVLRTGASFLQHQLVVLLRGLRNRRAAGVRRRLGAEYLLNLGLAVKALQDLRKATRDWPGPDEPEPEH